MIPKGDVAFLFEVEQYQFRYRCEDCVHFAPLSLRCSLGYPNRWLIGAVEDLPEDIVEDLFCKYFEMY